ncbi:MAG TPA: hypothetical protein PLS84_11575 [Salinivirgaceae bacterium]|jgi:hypothetical protein|nr:hypothetical protein [Salinivirgaceae bacterium]
MCHLPEGDFEYYSGASDRIEFDIARISHRNVTPFLLHFKFNVIIFVPTEKLT